MLTRTIEAPSGDHSGWVGSEGDGRYAVGTVVSTAPRSSRSVSTLWSTVSVRRLPALAWAAGSQTLSGTGSWHLPPGQAAPPANHDASPLSPCTRTRNTAFPVPAAHWIFIPPMFFPSIAPSSG